jgi:hypothetical protein
MMEFHVSLRFLARIKLHPDNDINVLIIDGLRISYAI